MTAKIQSDSDLVEKVLRREREAFDALVERHADALLRFATLTCRSAPEAEQAVREALLAAWNEAGKVGRNPRVWLFKHVRTACRQHRPAPPGVDAGGLLLALHAAQAGQPEVPGAGGVGCEEARSRLSDFIDGDLAPDDVARIQAHLEACESCSELNDGLRAIVESLHRRRERTARATTPSPTERR